MEFHHKDPSKKDFRIGEVANRKWDIIKQELDKCELLCSNCHRIEHSDRDNPILLKLVKNYKGTLFKMEK